MKMSAVITKMNMEILKETFILSECILNKCNKENKEFIASDIYSKYKEDYNKLETNADRKKVIKLLLSNDIYLTFIKCKYDKCFANINKLLLLVMKVISIFEQKLKIKTPVDVVKSIAIINDPKNTKVSFEIYSKNFLFHYLNIITYLKLIIIKSKKTT